MESDSLDASPGIPDGDDAAEGFSPADSSTGPSEAGPDDAIEQNSDEGDDQDDEAGRQRRQNVRVSVKYPIRIMVDGYPQTAARSRDLSATGVGFATRMPLEVDTVGHVEIEFPEWNFRKHFTVRFVKPILAGRIVGVQFDELTEDERERVVKEVFAVQRAQLQAQRARQKQMAGG